MLTISSSNDLNICKNDAYVPFFLDLIFGTISAVHFHHFSTHTTYGTRVCAKCDFPRIENRFTAPVTRRLEKCVDSNSLGKLRNFTC